MKLFFLGHLRETFLTWTHFSKQHSSPIIKPLTHLITLSITSGQFPDQGKKAAVSPIFKLGDSDGSYL